MTSSRGWNLSLTVTEPRGGMILIRLARCGRAPSRLSTGTLDLRCVEDGDAPVEVVGVPGTDAGGTSEGGMRSGRVNISPASSESVK